MSTRHCAAYRWESFCRPGMYLADISQALGCDWPRAHIHAHCVVDDFGTLQPVEFDGLTAQSQLTGSTS